MIIEDPKYANGTRLISLNEIESGAVFNSSGPNVYSAQPLKVVLGGLPNV